MIPRTEQLHAALRDVRRHEVVFHSGYASHVQGYAWREGGEMPEAEQQALRELAAVFLVAPITACVHNEIAAEVVLTRRGTEQLVVWEVAAQRARQVRHPFQDWCDRHGRPASGCIGCAAPDLLGWARDAIESEG